MRSDPDHGATPAHGASVPDVTQVTEPTAGESFEHSDWSEPTLNQLSLGDDPLAAPSAATTGPPSGEPGPEPGAGPAHRSGPESAGYYVPANRTRASYQAGTVEAWHPQLVERAADVAVAAMPIPLRVLDVGCGDGQLLAELILRVPYADMYVGLDPLPGVISDARRASDPRLSLVRGAAEALPFPDACFDLVIATMSVRYWLDQSAGVAELARVVSDTGKVVVVEATNTAGRIAELLEAAGLTVERTETVSRSRLGLAQARAFIAVP